MQHISLEQALATVKAAGYRVTKPKKPKADTKGIGPTCVVTFADGETVRMTTHSPPNKPLDWARGIRVASDAWRTRLRCKLGGGPLPSMDDVPPVSLCHFERNGEVLGTFVS